MELENSLPTLNQISTLFKKALRNSSFFQIQTDALGLIVDASYYEKNTQKITIVDHTQIQEPLDVFIRGSSKGDFASGVKIGDILHISNFVFFINKGKLVARVGQYQSRIKILQGYQDSQNLHEEVKGPSLTEKIENRAKILRKWSFDYFSTHKIPLKQLQKNKDAMNPECQTHQKPQFFDIIAKVISCIDENNGTFNIEMRNQHQNFKMNFPQKIEEGIYKIRGIVSAIEVEKNLFQLKRDGFTNFLSISSWMLSYTCIQTSVHLSTSEIKQIQITTRLLRRRDLPRVTLRNYLLQSTPFFIKADHSSDFIVSCQIIDILTPSSQAFKKLIVHSQQQQSKEKYHEEDYRSEKGFLICSMHLAITDPSMNGEVVNAYLYTYDGRGAQFIPELNPHQIREVIKKQPLSIQAKYDCFVNDILEKTSYENKPLELILSPTRKNIKGQVILRIVDTECVRIRE